jgi:hypothetical protein
VFKDDMESKSKNNLICCNGNEVILFDMISGHGGFNNISDYQLDMN